MECGEEYRPDAMICTDCGGRLQDRLDDGGARLAHRESSPAESAADPDEAFTERIVHEDQATDLVTAADRLVDEGIECRVRPAQPGTGYGLWVTAPDRERALAALGISTAAEAAANAHGEGAAGSRACPACGAAVPSGVIDCPECNLAVGDDAADDPAD